MPTPADQDTRIFVRNGRRHYRKRYSLFEFRLGLVILVALAMTAGWVAYKGRHPDPSLLGTEPALGEGASVHPPADRGPLPQDIAPPGWRETVVSSFDPDHLYEKINGRADYYKSFGCERLVFATLVQAAAPETVIDIELYVLPNAANALGTYAGERGTPSTASVLESGIGHAARNALYFVQGRAYIRLIGSEDSPVVHEALRHILASFQSTMPSEPLPWGYDLLAETLRYDVGQIEYQSENAFSFDFGRQVYAAPIDDEGGQIFVVASPSDKDATNLAHAFVAGFLEYGTRAEKDRPGTWVQDRYLGTISTAMAHGAWVMGVRGAKTAAEATPRLESLRQGLDAKGAEFHARAMDENAREPAKTEE
ncbi:MAG: hypothetical protein IPK13_20630 [Deltaproteobacteria bacterium]|nr:hypothetical protein [Deltaproteobacteria bacterium]